MLDLTRSRPAVIRCLADAAALDTLAPPSGGTVVRVAPDELLLVGGAASAAALTEAASVVRGAFVVDDSDAWEALTLAGPDAEEAFRRVSAVPLPRTRPAAVQGSVGGLAAKVLVHGDRVVVLVTSSAGDFLHERIADAMNEGRP